jgi:PAS domain S-box-containing protein
MGDSIPDEDRTSPRWLHAVPVIYLPAGLIWILGSDLLVGWLYRDDPQALVYASTLKGAMFVILTATLLYVLLKVRPTDEPADRPGPDPFELRKPLIAFALVASTIATIGYFVFMLEANAARDRLNAQLASYAMHGAAELSLWHDGNVRVMRQVAASPFTARAIVEWQQTGLPSHRDLLHERLEAIRTNQDYASVALYTTGGEGLLAVGRAVPDTGATRRLVREAAAARDVVIAWGEVDVDDRAGHPVVELATPLSHDAPGGREVVAVVLVRADVKSQLMTVQQPGGPHSRLVLAKIARDRLTVLTPGLGAAVTRELDAVDSEVEAAIVSAVQRQPRSPPPGARGTLATGHQAAGTPWFAVATVERAGLESQIHRLMLAIVGMSALGFAGTAALVLPWWRSVRMRARTLIGEAESRAEAISTRLGWVTRHANDAVLLIAWDGRILDVNERALQFYGYTREEMLAFDVFRLRVQEPAQQIVAHAQYETVRRGAPLVFETTHVRRDGTRFPVEVSSRAVEQGGEKYVQSIVRDISDRRRAEDRVRASEAQYRLLFKSNPLAMWVYDLQTRSFLAVNDAAVAEYGYTEDEFLAMTIADIRPVEDRARLDAHIQSNVGVLQHSRNWRHRRKDGTVFEVAITSHSIEFAGRSARLVMAHDVTAQALAERELRASEERYRGLFENASDGIVVLGEDRRILAANAEYCAMVGYASEELRTMRLADLLDPQEQPRLAAAGEAWRRGHRPGPGTWLHRRKDGSQFPGEVRTRQLPGGDMLATVRDLTEIVAARRRIERQRDLYDLLSQCNQAIVKVMEPEELLRSLARLAVDRGGFKFAWVGSLDDAGTIVPTAHFGDDGGYVQTLRFSVDPGSPDASGPASRAIREGRAVVVNDFLNDPATACWHEAARRAQFAASAAFPIRAGGRVVAALMLYAAEAGFFDAEICSTIEEVVVDVSYALDALRTRADLEDSRLLLRSVIDAADALVFAFDLDGRAILMNEACARAMGGPRESLIGRRRAEVMPQATAAAHERNDRRVVESGTHLVVEETNDEAGRERVYLSVKYPLRDREGRVYAVGGIATDITELRRTQLELAAANQLLEVKVAERTREAMEARVRAETADRAKTIFLTSMSHELRSPLHSIIGFTSVLIEGLEGELTKVQQDHLQIISESSHHLLAIINDLLDMSRIEAGAIPIDVAPFVIDRALQRVVQRVRLQAQEKGLALQFIAPDSEIWLDGDERRIEQVVGNLVSNAVKYTRSGSVTVSCRRAGESLRIEVADTGPGIAKEDQGRLFKRFSQLDPSPGGIVEGAGLGLAIAAGLAEAMGGEIQLHSEPDVGSVFSLVLPLRVTEEGSNS